MGSVVSAKCDCGFSKEGMRLGGGMMNHGFYCNFPHFCKQCKLFFEANLNDDVCCPECSSKKVVSYDNKKARRCIGYHTIFSWGTKLGELKLTNGRYFCPYCNKYKIKFFWAGCWD